MLAFLVLVSSFNLFAAGEVVPARMASSVTVAMNEVMAGVIPTSPGCQATPPYVCGGKDKIPNYNPQHYRSRHGQIFFGSGPFYISHLPLINRPHNFQAIYEVDFPDTQEGRAAKAQYLSRQDQGFASFDPGESWSYPDFDCSIGPDGRVLAPGGLHQGQFEDGGAFITETSLVIKRRIFFRIWPPGSLGAGAGNPRADGEYIVFGEGDQFFTARVINSVPDADHIQPVPAAMFRGQVGGANHACYNVAQVNGQMNFNPKNCDDTSAPAPTGAVQSVSFNPFYVETEDISL